MKSISLFLFDLFKKKKNIIKIRLERGHKFCFLIFKQIKKET